MESTSSYFQDIIIPSFAWLVFLIILGAYVALGFRTWRAFRRNEFKLRLDDTLGLPKGTIRSFIVITFTAIMFLVFFGDFAGVTIPPEDRKWFLTAYGSVLAFYFGTKYFPERFASRGLAISSVSPPVSNPPPKRVRRRRVSSYLAVDLSRRNPSRSPGMDGTSQPRG